MIPGVIRQYSKKATMNRRDFIKRVGAGAFLGASTAGLVAKPRKKPNVILVLTDDQGYGDLACHGNPAIQTPHLDKLYTQSTRLTNFHVDPTCAPTRSALMTGRYSNRTGVWHTIQGRNLLRRREVTMADVFVQNGYETGIFGKWHLGDSYPFRPQDRGFKEVVIHGGGGVTQTPDFWGNDYFDDTYRVNGEPKAFKGYCTDVWFDCAMDFIRQNSHRPFFCYLSTNAPHGPLYCPEKYLKMYDEIEEESLKAFYGMITNIDDNMARLDRLLDELKLADNTIVLFMTDNGTATGARKGGFLASMTGKKSSQYEGGHRVPCFIRWPGGKLKAAKDIDQLTAHLDILPTVIDLCQLEDPGIQFDGTSLRDLLYENGQNWPDRSVIVESQRILNPQKWRKCAVMTQQWRLINGCELYDVQKDPMQKNDIAAQHPDVVKRLKKDYEKFWADVSQDHHITSRYSIGSPRQNPVTLTAHDWLAPDVPWNQKQIGTKIGITGGWSLEVERSGIYEISLRRWPKESDLAINDTFDDSSKSVNAEKARLRIGAYDQTQTIPSGAKEVSFRVDLEKGTAELQGGFIGETTTGAFYAYVNYKKE